MERNKIIDPRFTWTDLEKTEFLTEVRKGEMFQTFEVFHQENQKNKTSTFTHVGLVHAPLPDMAMGYAITQYARRGTTLNIWVARSMAIIPLQKTEDKKCFLKERKYEVFTQKKSGDHFVHRETIDGKDLEKTLSAIKSEGHHDIWILKQSHITALGEENKDMFEEIPSQTFRLASGYPFRNKVEKFKREHGKK